MKLRYSLNADDYLKFQLFIASRTRQIIRRRSFARWFIPALYAFIAALFYISSLIPAASLFAVFALFWFFFYPIYSRKRYIRFYSRYINEHFSDNFNRDFYIETLENEFVLQSHEANSNVKYSAVNSIFDLSTHFLIKLNPGTVIILPVDKADKSLLVLLINELSIKSGKSILDFRQWRWK